MDAQLTKIKKDMPFSGEKVAKTLENFGFLKMKEVKEVQQDELTQPSFHSSDEEDPAPVDQEFISDQVA